MASIEGITIELELIEGRNLVPKDRKFGLLGKKNSSDPYVMAKTLNVFWTIMATSNNTTQLNSNTTTAKTKVIPKTLNPRWNERFKVEISQRQLKKYGDRHIPPVMLYIFDEDKASADDPMGTVVVEIDPKAQPKAQWLPVTTGSGKYHCHNATGELCVKVTVNVRQVMQLVQGNVHALKHPRVSVGFAWDPEKGKNIDLDASCVALSQSGEVLMDQTVYYGNPCNAQETIMHTGDETTGEASGDDETIILNLQYVPETVLALYLILSVVTPNNSFLYIPSAKVRFYYSDKAGEHAICGITPSQILGSQQEHTSLIVGRISRTPGRPQQWNLSPIEAGTSPARDFGSLIPQIKSYTRDLLPNIAIDPAERVAIMRKNGVIRIQDFCPFQKIPTTVSFALAWDITDGVNIDLDASAICLNCDLEQEDVIFFNQLSSKDGAIQHLGDERSGASTGDDETINILLENVSMNTQYIGIVVNSYSGQELDDVARASCRLYDTETRCEIARYALTDSKPLDKHTALVMGCLYRGSGGDWMLAIISEAALGKTAFENVDELQNFLRRNPLPPQPTVNVEAVKEEEIQVGMPAYVAHNAQEGVVVVPSTNMEEEIFLPSW